MRFPWIGPALRRHIDRHVEPDVSTPSEVTRSVQWRYRTLHRPFEAHVFELTQMAASRGHLAVTSPFYDTRLIQFAFDVPERERWRGSDRRWLERRALRSRAPVRVVFRRDKARFRPTYEEQVRRLDMAAILSSSRVRELGWVRTDDVASLVGRGEQVLGASVRQLWSVVAIEAWLRTAWE
jgi:hypothetical protein